MTQHRKCPICFSKRVKVQYQLDNYCYFLCVNCITVFLSPQPQNTEKYYQNDFEYSAGLNEEARLKKHSQKIIKKLTKLNPDGKKLLDIGSGFGYLLDECKRLNLSSTGIEPSIRLYEISKKKRLNVINTSLDNFQTGEKFDFVCAVHVIEHTTSPERFLTQALKLLKPNGILFIETPNVDSYLHTAEKESYTFLTPPDHIWLFSKYSLIKLFEKVAKKSVGRFEFKTYSYPEHFSGIIKIILGKKHTDRPVGRAENSKKLKTKSPYILSHLKYLLFDILFARLLYRLLNFNDKGSILELYYVKE